MINYETILSLFDDKLTLLEYLTKIEQALKNEQLTDITVTQTDASHVYFTFVFEDSTTIDTPTFTLPAGPQGATGAQGVSVTGATINASNHLILTLSNGNTIDAGNVAVSNNVVSLSGLGGTLTNEQYALLQANGSLILLSERYYEKVFEDSTSIDFEVINFAFNSTIRYRIVITKSTKAWTFVSHSAIIPATNVYAQGVTDGKVLTVDNGASKWADPMGLTSVKASNVDSETATSGKVLTANGSGGATWEDAQGGLTSVKVSDIDSESTGANFSILSNGSGGATWGAPPVTAGQVTSVGATAGQVLTADGANGVSWQTPSGGTQKYMHYVRIKNNNDNILFSYISEKSTSSTTLADVMSDMNTEGYGGKYIIANGTVLVGSNHAIVLAIQKATSDLYVLYADGNTLSNTSLSGYSLNTDFVIAL